MHFQQKKYGHFYFLLLLFLTVNTVSGQLANQHWYFGDSCHIVFENVDNELVPTIQTNGPRPNRQIGGVVSISDEQGNFLFYSDGQELRDRNMNVIRDDLRGGELFTTSALAVAMPCQTDQYYLFTTAHDVPGNPDPMFHDSVFYSIVRMNGLEVASVSDPVFLTDSVNEKGVIIPHPDGTDFWFINPTYANFGPGSQTFQVSRFGCNGIISSTRQSFATPFGLDGSAGYVKASPNGRFLVNARTIGNFDILEFNPITGEVAYCRRPPISLGRTYGVEFSDDGCSVFLTVTGASFNDTTRARLIHHRVDIDLTEEVYFGPLAPFEFVWEAGALQKGPDGFVYVAMPFANRLGRFDPNALDPLSTLDENFLTFGPSLGSVGYGLPLPTPPPLTDSGCLPWQKSEICQEVELFLEPNDNGNCCYDMIINQPFTAEEVVFTRIEVNLVSSEGLTGFEAFPAPIGWLIEYDNNGRFTLTHESGTIPVSENLTLFSLCLPAEANGGNIPIIADWITEQGTVCAKDIIAECSSDCTGIIDGQLVCGETSLRYNFSFVNQSSYPVNTMRLVNAVGSSDQLLNELTIELGEMVGIGEAYSGSISIDFIDVNNDGQFCFDVILRQVVTDQRINLFCCYITHCLEIETEELFPSVDLVESLLIDCDEMPQLDASTSVPPPGESATYSWTTNDGILISGANGAQPFVDGVGTYQLVIINELSGCSDTASIVLSEVLLPPAVLGDDIRTCAANIEVIGNDLTEISGAWTAIDGVNSVWSATDNVAIITSLAQEGLTLVWTLSTSSCPDYSSDTILILPDATITAINDTILFEAEGGDYSQNILDNDLVLGPRSFRFLGTPEFGTLEATTDGDVSYSSPACFTGTDDVPYEICSLTCLGVCDTANLTLTGAGAREIYNAITPNGDGINDVFVFDLCEQENEGIEIFNRWGDIVYRAKPYENDWDGTNQKGGELPEATYYYVLRVNIGEGDIIKGDITVIR